MIFIDKNEGLINYFTEKFNLLSSKLYKVDVYNDIGSELAIDLYFELLYTDAEKFIKLSFKGIKVFSFYHQRDSYFYNVERYKFFKSKECYYLCLDPCDEEVVVSERDQNFILGDEVTGFLVPGIL